MKELLMYLLTSITGISDEIQIETVEENGEVRFNVTLPESYRALVIGKSGMNIKALRRIISIIAKRENKRAYINLLD